VPRRGHRHRPYRLSGGKLLHVLRDRAAQRQNMLCHWCGIEMRTDVEPNHPQFLTAEHLIPKHAGGKTRPGNIVAACRKCNNERHPEMNRSPQSAVVSYSCGDDRPHSPFAVLRKQNG